MAIQFVVEDGTGKIDSTSYVSVDDYLQYWEDRGEDYSGVAETTVKALLNRATDYIDGLFPYMGYKRTTTQALEFPRDFVVDRNGIDQSDSLPNAIVYATCEAAKYSYDGNALFEALSSAESKSVGTVSVSYGSGGQRPVKLRSVLRLIGDLRAPNRVLR